MIDNFDHGYNAGLNALEDLSIITESPDHNMFAGLLSSIINCMYYYAPSEHAADDLIQFAVTYAKKENAKKGMILPKGA